jgi:hypothetical protein
LLAALHHQAFIITQPQAVEKLVLSKLLVEGSSRRIFNVDQHIGMVCGAKMCCHASQLSS